ncbi:hypothetical protein SMICM304S_08786 [Streptomyces microflavus]
MVAAEDMCPLVLDNGTELRTGQEVYGTGADHDPGPTARKAVGGRHGMLHHGRIEMDRAAANLLQHITMPTRAAAVQHGKRSRPGEL